MKIALLIFILISLQSCQGTWEREETVFGAVKNTFFLAPNTFESGERKQIITLENGDVFAVIGGFGFSLDENFCVDQKYLYAAWTGSRWGRYKFSPKFHMQEFGDVTACFIL